MIQRVVMLLIEEELKTLCSLMMRRLLGGLQIMIIQIIQKLVYGNIK